MFHPFPKKHYINPVSCSLWSCFSPEQSQPFSCSMSVCLFCFVFVFSSKTYLVCEVCCAMWLCGNSWLPTARIPLHLNGNAYSFCMASQILSAPQSLQIPRIKTLLILGGILHRIYGQLSIQLSFCLYSSSTDVIGEHFLRNIKCISLPPWCSVIREGTFSESLASPGFTDWISALSNTLF